MKRLPCALALALAASEGRAHAQAQPPAQPALPPPGIPSLAYSDGFVLQNDWGLVRLYPRVSLSVDVHGTSGAGASALRGADGGPELSPRVVVRRGVVEVGGGAFGFLDLDLTLELDGRGTYGDRLLPNPHDLKVGIPNAWINAEAGPALNLMLGIQPTPFSLEHRTDPDDLFSLEPSLASQLAVPFARALGATVWGTTLHKDFGYDVMWLAAAGNTIPTSVSENGAAGRVFYRPYGLTGSRWDRLQIGVSGRYTVRDGQSADMTRDDFTTDNGFALWSRRFVDSLGRTEDILASGTQRALGVEVVLPTFQHFQLTGEVYVFDDDTREAVESLAASTTERLGSLSGAGWYGELSYLVAPLLPGQRQWIPNHDVPYESIEVPPDRPLSPPQAPRRARRAEPHQLALGAPAHAAGRARGRRLPAHPRGRHARALRRGRPEEPGRTPRRVGAGRLGEHLVDPDLPAHGRVGELLRAQRRHAAEPRDAARAARGERGRGVDARAHGAGAALALTVRRGRRRAGHDARGRALASNLACPSARSSGSA